MKIRQARKTIRKVLFGIGYGAHFGHAMAASTVCAKRAYQWWKRHCPEWQGYHDSRQKPADCVAGKRMYPRRVMSEEKVRTAIRRGRLT